MNLGFCLGGIILMERGDGFIFILSNFYIMSSFRGIVFFESVMEMVISIIWYRFGPFLQVNILLCVRFGQGGGVFKYQ